MAPAIGLMLAVLACAPASTPQTAAANTVRPSSTSVSTSSSSQATAEQLKTTLTGRIVFDHEFDIWTMNADGTDRVLLTDHPAEDFDPAWSPDGTMIAFRSHRDGHEEIYVMAADGSGQRNVTMNPATDYSPTWSPDGTRIAFASNRDPDSGGNDIYTVMVDGSDPSRLTVGGGIDEYPSWSPDGKEIAYACTGGRQLSDGGGDFEVCVMNSDGSNQRQITDAPGISEYPAWSPDGRIIAFMTTREGWPTLPDYVPLGYDSEEFGEHEIFAMGANGEKPHNITRNGRESEEFPAWSPDGQQLIFTRYGCLVVSSRDGSASTQITGTACADGFPDWHG
jgi:Tol biopolymer transport system component